MIDPAKLEQVSNTHTFNAVLVAGKAGAGAIVKAAAEGRVASLFLSENAGTGGQPEVSRNILLEGSSLSLFGVCSRPREGD